MEGRGVAPFRREIEYDVVVSIDFGTHGTAVASRTGAHEVFAENELGKTPDTTPNEKTPTTLLMTDELEVEQFGAAAVDAYTQMDEKEIEDFLYFEKFKMALFEPATEETGESMMLDTIEADNGMEVSTRTILEEALKHIREFVIEKSKLSGVYPALTVKKIQWVLTVPAIWTEKAKKIMREAASNAGLITNGPSQLLIAKEPECASIAVRDSIEDGATYILVDAGGGTIDIACHKKIGNEVVEVFPPTGGPWGSTKIDEAFGDMLVECFGKDAIDEFRGDEEFRSQWVQQMQNFANSKDQSVPNKHRNINLTNEFNSFIRERFGAGLSEHVAAFEYQGVTKGLSIRGNRALLKLSADMWDRLFAVVLDPIRNHIERLLEEPNLRECSQIVLVGGFGNSERLYRALEEVAQARHPPIVVFQAPKPNLAVVKGAALFPSVKNSFVRIAQRTYGVESLVKWIDGVHPDDDFKVDFRGQFRYRKGFKVFVKIGDQLKDDHVMSHRFRAAASGGVTVSIFSSLKENPATTHAHSARKLGSTFIDFNELSAEVPGFNTSQELKILFRFGGSEFSAELQFESGLMRPLDCDFNDLSYAAEVSQRYQRPRS